MDFFANLGRREADAVRALNPAQLEAAYRIQELDFRTDDAERHAEILYPDRFGEGDFREMAAIFLDGCDCNLDENSQWDLVIEDYAASCQGDPDFPGDRDADIARFLSGLSPAEADAVRVLDPAQLEAAYRIQELVFRTDDAERHAEILYPDRFGKDDFREMAMAFLDGCDCNLSENDQWDRVIEDHAAASGKPKARNGQGARP